MAWRPGDNTSVGVDWSSNSFAATPSFSDVTNDVVSWRVTRGRSGLFGGPFTPGVATVILESTDGTYNPRNITQVSDRPIRIQVNSTNIFQGWVRDIATTMTPFQQRAVLECVDALGLLAVATITGFDDSASLSGNRISHILDELAWPAAYTGTINIGVVMCVPLEVYNGTALPTLQAVAFAEGGQFYADTNSDLQFRQRHAHLVETEQSASQVTFGETGTTGTYVPIKYGTIEETLGSWRRVRKTLASAYSGTIYQAVGRPTQPRPVRRRWASGQSYNDGAASTIFSRARDLGNLVAMFDADAEFAAKMYQRAANTNQVYPSRFDVLVDPGNAQALTEIAAGDIDLMTRCTVKYTPPGEVSQQTENGVIESLTWTCGDRGLVLTVGLSNYDSLYSDTNWSKFGTANTANSILGW